MNHRQAFLHALLITFLLFTGFAVAAPVGQNVVIGYYFLNADQINHYTETDTAVVPFPISRITAERARQLTHINFSFLDINAKGECAWDVAIEAGKAHALAARLGALRQHNPQLRIMMVVGGWDYTHDGGKSVKNYRRAVSTPSLRKRLAASCLRLMKGYQFDGIDIDWEYPRPDDAANYAAALKEIRRLLSKENLQRGNKPYQLTIAGSGGAAYLSRYYNHLPQIVQQLDYINLMTYDLAGAWDSVSNHQAALFGDPAGPMVNNALRNIKHNLSTEQVAQSFPSPFALTADASVRQHLLAGIPANKIVMGVPFYGRAFSGVAARDNGQYSDHTTSTADPYQGDAWLVGCAACAADKEPRIASYASISEMLKGNFGYERHFNKLSTASYLFHPSKRLFVTYDDEISLMYKAKYIRSENLAGVMFWHLGQDDAEGNLLGALHHYLNDANYDDTKVDLGAGLRYAPKPR